VPEPTVRGQVRVPGPILRSWVAALLQGLDVSDEHAEATARILVEADARGHPSHGVARLPAYVRQLRAGSVDGRAVPRLVSSAGGTATIDGGNGLGHHTSERAMRHAIELAATHGVGLVAVRNSNHHGIVAAYLELASTAGMVGLATTNSGASVAPTGSAAPFLGTNPIGFAAPTAEGPDLVLDMATSVVSGGKFEVAKRASRPVPEGWGVDAEGRPTTDPSDVFGRGGWMLPLGSTAELSSHKGFGLGLLVEVLSAVLAGGPVGPAVGNLTFATRPTPSRVSHGFLAIAPHAFGGEAALRERVTGLVRGIAELPGTDGSGARAPGSRAAAAQAEASRFGVPLDEVVLASLDALAAELAGPPLEREAGR
jgi:LDH2 family malate/lactate/ureidoglycolate dehydrogenase